MSSDFFAKDTDDTPQDRLDFTKPVTDTADSQTPRQIIVRADGASHSLNYVPGQKAKTYLSQVGVSAGLFSGRAISLKKDGGMHRAKGSTVVDEDVTEIVVNTKVHNG